jgi:tripartite-type tricarboxylate transporter receptor subunit TctC
LQNLPRTMIHRCTGTRRSLLAGLAVAAVLASSPAQAQTDWPARTVTVIVPFAAGGNTDIMARMASQKLAEAFKQSFIVDNRVGAGGALAANYVAQAAPDGYTLFFAAAPLIAVLPKVQKVNYDPHKDFIPVSVFGTGPFILAIGRAIAAKTIPEFVAYAKTRQINYGSGEPARSVISPERCSWRARAWTPSISPIAAAARR